MKRALFLALALMVAPFITAACGEAAQPSVIQSTNVTQTQVIDLGVVTTVGDHSYIPFNLDGDASQHVSEILSVLAAFEKAHPDWEITNWKVEEQHHAYFTGEHLYGIWVDHRSAQ